MKRLEGATYITRNTCFGRLSVRPVELIYSHKEQGTERAHPGRFGFDRPPRERKIDCIVLSSPLNQKAFPPLLSRRLVVSMFGAVRSFC